MLARLKPTVDAILQLQDTETKLQRKWEVIGPKSHQAARKEKASRILPSGTACMHKTRCGPQARQWNDYFLTGFEACSITQKVHQNSSKTMAIEVKGPSGELTSVV